MQKRRSAGKSKKVISKKSLKSNMPLVANKQFSKNVRYGFILAIVVIICIISTALVLFTMEKNGAFDKKLEFSNEPGSARVSLYVVEPADNSQESANSGVESNGK